MKEETFAAYNISDFRELARRSLLSWDELRTLRKMWPHTLMVKGIADVPAAEVTL